MNWVNRILIVLELIVLIIVSLACIGILIFARPMLQTTFAPTLAALSAQDQNPSQVIGVGIFTLTFAFSILLLLLELAPRGAQRLKIQSTQGVEVLMSADAITQQLEYALDALTDVLKVRAQVVGTRRGEGVDVFAEMWTTPDVDVRAKTEEAAGVARQVVEDKLGLKVGKVQIKLDQMKAPAKKSLALPPAKSMSGLDKM